MPPDQIKAMMADIEANIQRPLKITPQLAEQTQDGSKWQPSLDTVQTALFTFFQTEFNRQRETDFALLRRIPSTDALYFLDYFATLSDIDQTALIEALAYRALVYYCFHPSDYSAFHNSLLTNLAYKRYTERDLHLLGLGENWKYHGTRSLKGHLALGQLYPASDEVVQKARAIQPVKAPEIRKVVKAVLAQAFSASALNLGEGLWRYTGVYQALEIDIDIAYNNWIDNLRYGISIRDQQRPLTLVRFSYDALWAIHLDARWDCLEQSNLEAAITLLKELVIYCAELLLRFPTEYAHPNTNNSPVVNILGFPPSLIVKKT